MGIADTGGRNPDIPQLYESILLFLIVIGRDCSFFQLEDPLLASLKEDLDAADLNNMTPLQAFDLLRVMKEKMGLTNM